MNRAAVVNRCAISAFAILATASVAAAQPGVYLSGVAFADIKQFDSIDYSPYALIDGLGGSSFDGTAAGGGVRVGTFLHPLWTLELGVEAESRTTNPFTNPFEDLLAQFPSSLRIPEISSSSSFLTVNTVVGFHPATSGRIRLGYLGGFSFVRGTYRTTLPDFQILQGDLFFDIGEIGLGAFTSLGQRTLTFPNFPTATLQERDNAAGLILGFEAAISASTKISVVPGIRAIVFSNGGQSVFLIRPELGVRWGF